MDLTHRLPDWILVDFRCDLHLEFSRSNMKFTISRPKIVRLPRNKKQTYRLNSMPKMWPLDLTLAMTLTLNFHGQIWNLPYLSQRWFDCHKMKSKHIEWTEGLNDNQVWPWPWPWRVRYEDLPESDRGDFRCQHAFDSSSLMRYCGFMITHEFMYPLCLFSKSQGSVKLRSIYVSNNQKNLDANTIPGIVATQY